MRTFRTPADVSLPNAQACEAAARKRAVRDQHVFDRFADAGAVEPSPGLEADRIVAGLSIVQPSMRTFLHESTSMPSRLPVIVTFLMTTSVQ
jgi:hypothetical protein